MKSQTIAVIGAGIIGVTSAFLLSRRGCRIILIDAGDGPAQGASYANGAQLSYSYTDAMSSPSLVKKMPGILLGRDPAFRVKMSADTRFVDWAARFVFQSLPSREERNTRNILRLSMHSREVLHSMLERHSIDFDHRNSGKLHIYSTQADLEKASVRVRQKMQWGCPQQVLGAEQCLTREPSLGQLKEPIAGGVYSPIDEVGNCPAFAKGLLDIMREEQVIEERFNTTVTNFFKSGNRISAIKTTNGTIAFDQVVIAAGPESSGLCRAAGVSVPIYPIKGYSITVPASDLAPDICITDVDNKVVFGRVGGLLRVAGCADIVGYDKTLRRDRIEHLLAISAKRFPKAGRYDEILEEWSGFRPVTPSSAPIIGKAGAENLYLNIGHGMLGWTLAMGSASLLSSIVHREALPIDNAGFRPSDHRVR